MGKGGIVPYDNGDFLKILFQLNGSIFDNVAVKLFVTVVLSFIAACLQHFLGWFTSEQEFMQSSEYFMRMVANSTEVTGEYNFQYRLPAVETIGFTMSGTSIAFLLVFRSVISYNRFWEGRGHLGAIMADSRDFARQVAFAIDDDKGEGAGKVENIKELEVAMNGGGTEIGESSDTDFQNYNDKEGVRNITTTMNGYRRLRFMRYLLMFWRLLVKHARDETGPADILSLHAHFQAPIPTTITTPVEEQFLVGKKRRPLVIVNILSHLLKQEYQNKKLTYMEYEAMSENLSGLIMGFNGVDKVHNVPIPFPYAQMLVVLLSAYCFLSPFMMVQYFSWFTFLPCGVLTVAFFGINEVAIEIEDPFGDDENDLPLDQMGNALKADCEMNLAVAQVPKANVDWFWQEISVSKVTSRKKHEVERANGVHTGTGYKQPGFVDTCMKKGL